MTTPVKIKIECDDPLLNAAVASAVADGLARADFNNVQVRSVMVYAETRHDADGAPLDFERKNVINNVLGDDVMAVHEGWRATVVMTELHPSWVLGHPYMVDHLRQSRPELLGSPVLLDMGNESPDYAKNLRAFLSGETKAQPRGPVYQTEDFEKRD